MQNGQILDSQITASSHKPNFEAFKARYLGLSCWRSNRNVIGEFLQVNFLSQRKYIAGLKLHGDPNADNWTEMFYLAYSLGSVWNNVTHQQDGSAKVC